MVRFIILITTSIALLGGLAVNIWARDAPFNYNQQIVPKMQANSFLSSDFFIILMNIVSNLFNPIACAGYILAFYVISHRKMQLLVFLLWFIIMSVGLSFLKALFQQARPYWIGGSGVKMLQWTCYTEYGCPSGHSMLGLVLIEFIIRFINRTRVCSKREQIIMYSCGFSLQALVIYSRMILGMHSLNQVLFGLMLGFASIVYYYTVAELALLKFCLLMTRKFYRTYILIVTTNIMLVSVILMLLTLYWPTYDNQKYTPVIQSFSRCKGFQIYASFQYKCFIDMSLLMAGFGIIYGLVFMKNQQNLLKKTTFPRLSKQFFKRLLITLLISMIPAAIFLNPLWKQVDMDDQKKALFLWFLQSCGLLFSTTLMISLAPRMSGRFGLESYLHHSQKNEPNILEEEDLQTVSTEKRKSKPRSPIEKNDSIQIPP